MLWPDGDDAEKIALLGPGPGVVASFAGCHGPPLGARQCAQAHGPCGAALCADVQTFWSAPPPPPGP